MVPRAPKPERREQDLIVIPEAERPRRWGPIAAIVAGVLALILIVALAAYALNQRDRAGDLDSQLTTALDDQRSLVDAAAASRLRIATLESRVGVLEGDLQRSKQGRSVLLVSRRETRAELRQARAALEEEQARFRSFMGPSIGDGTHVGRLVAVGADQSPARITTDLGRWFTGNAATQAAVADGTIVAGERLPRYFRNDDLVWRTLPIDPLATVTVLRRGGTVTISLAELQRLSRAESRRADRISHDPFRMSVVDGRVTALHELRYP